MNQIVALLTDFGNRDGFVGAIKGVLLSINPKLNIVDISHEIEPFDILEASLTLNATYRYFPAGTIFLSVVDPGVGTDRRSIIVKTSDYLFVSPDNGLLTLPLRQQYIEKIIAISNRQYFLDTDTNTFHGRDIFAPVVAHISRGEPIHKFGEEIFDFAKMEELDPVYDGNKVVGKIIKFDRFGNGITNIQELPPKFIAYYRGFEIKQVCNNFLQGLDGRPNIIRGSFGYYELFIPKGSLRDSLKAQVGDPVEVYRI